MSKEKVFSFSKGVSFSFEDEGSEIVAWFSLLSGLEKVYVDGEMVSSQRNFSINSSNTFNIGQNEYSVNLKAASLFKGPFVCTLSKNGHQYKRKKLVFPKLQSKTGILGHLVRFTFFIVLGGLFGLARAYWHLPGESVYVFIALVIFLVFYYYLSPNRDSAPVIVDEEID